MKTIIKWINKLLGIDQIESKAAQNEILISLLEKEVARLKELARPVAGVDWHYANQGFVVVFGNFRGADYVNIMATERGSNPIEISKYIAEHIGAKRLIFDGPPAELAKKAFSHFRMESEDELRRVTKWRAP